MHTRIGCPPKHEDAYGHQDASHDGGRQAKLGLAGSLDTRFLLKLVCKVVSYAVPPWIGGQAGEEAHKDAQKRQPNLPQVEAMIGGEDEGERPKEEIQDPQQQGREDAEIKTHGLKDE